MFPIIPAAAAAADVANDNGIFGYGHDGSGIA